MKSSAGLTLIEIVVAVTLFTGVALITAVMLRTGLRAADSANAAMSSLERTRTAVEMMSAQIESVIPISASSKKSLFRGDRLSLSFPTCISIWNGPAGNVISEYRIEPDTGGTWRLCASERVIGTDHRRETVLLKGLSEAGLAYASAASGPEAWKESWTDDQIPPRKVRISLKSASYQGDVVVLIRTGDPDGK